MASFPLMGFSRHRIGTDGKGVTTLVAAHGCPLRCRYCLNPACLDPAAPVRRVSPEELYAMLRPDDLYFRATGGGPVFGGGEPLLYAPFIREMRKVCGRAWRFTAETSLNVPEEAVRDAAGCVDDFIVDAKDTDPSVYRAYTGQSGERALSNLALLLKLAGPSRVTVRVPHIPFFNTPEGVEKSVALLRKMGAVQIDRFTYRLPEEMRGAFSATLSAPREGPGGEKGEG